jgi:C_GCAxxG_C_C family probable redox protein
VTKPEAAVATFRQHFNCSQAVLSAFAEELGLNRDAALRVAAGFGGGMGRMGATCGAVTGAIVALGLKYGATRSDDLAAKEKTHELVRELARRFQQQHGSLQCRELIGCDISTPENYQRARQQQVFVNLCPNYVRAATAIAEQLL